MRDGYSEPVMWLSPLSQLPSSYSLTDGNLFSDLVISISWNHAIEVVISVVLASIIICPIFNFFCQLMKFKLKFKV